jgi:hypothetical protein
VELALAQKTLAEHGEMLKQDLQGSRQLFPVCLLISDEYELVFVERTMGYQAVLSIVLSIVLSVVLNMVLSLAAIPLPFYVHWHRIHNSMSFASDCSSLHSLGQFCNCCRCCICNIATDTLGDVLAYLRSNQASCLKEKKRIMRGNVQLTS